MVNISVFSKVRFPDTIQNKDRAVLPILYLAVFLLLGSAVYIFEPFPRDDFLRHIRHLDYQPLGGYSYMFPYSYFESLSFNPWAGFDAIAGTIKNLLGPGNTVVLFELLFSGLFVAALLFNLKTARRSDLFPVTVAAVCLFLSESLSRVSLIRPAILWSIAFLFCLRGRGVLTGLLVSAAGAWLYWLFWVYTVPLSIAHHFLGDRKFSMGLITGTVISLASWALLTEGDYGLAIYHLAGALLNERNGIAIGENIISIGRAANPVVFIVSSIFALTVYRWRKLDFHSLLILITAPAAVQTRYFLDITFPMMFLYSMNNNAEAISSLIRKYRPVMEAVGLASFILIIPAFMDVSLKEKDAVTFEGLNVDQGAVVFTDSLPLNFQAIYHNPAPIRVIPSAEIGWNDEPAKVVFKRIAGADVVDQGVCGYFERYGIRYLLTEKEVRARCLDPVRTFANKGGTRRVGLWQAH